MRILWITNMLFPEAKRLIKYNDEFRASGGWMLGAAESMLHYYPRISLSVASVSSLVSKLTIVKGKRIVYYIIPYGKGNLKPNTEYESFWIEINNLCNPDVVHIHGTEYSHGLAFLNACPEANTVISIQGLTSVLYYYYYYGLNKYDIVRNISIRDIFRGSIFTDMRKLKKRGENIEKIMLQKAKHIIGRTSWDKAHTWAINPISEYYICNETLRPEFYKSRKWEYKRCEKYTIFLSQASYPLKGLHQVLKAMPLILRHFPNTKIKVAGQDITKHKTLHDKLFITGYGKLIRRMICTNHLKNHIEFLGPLNAEQMKCAYLQCNVFVCPSSVENSPNSLAEAQILGVPHLASYVGGVADMMTGNETNLYRFEDIEMLAEKICYIFRNKELQVDMSSIAHKRHDQFKNAKQLVEIYNRILK